MILDAGVLVSIDRGDRAALTLMTAVRRHVTPVRTTHPVVAQVWRSGHQARLAQFLKTVEEVHALDEGRAVGRLLVASGTADVVDAHLVHVALRTGEPILAGDTGDLQRIAAAVDLPVEVMTWP